MGDRVLYSFDWLEYGVFGAILGLSALTGIYFGFIKKSGQDTVSGYLFGGKQMTLLPVSMSLVSSFTSGITLLGVPAEVYVYGTQYLVCAISCIVLGVLVAFVFIPVFYKLQYISLYEYLEHRFDYRLRKVASAFFTINVMCYIPVVIYGPALAINQVSGINVYLVATVLCTICIFYTTVGGLKAVVWSDTLQAAMMVLCVVLVTLIGSWRLGGFANVFEAAYKGGRIEFFNMDPDPTLRISFWSASLGILFHWTGNVAVHPAAIQRFMSLPTMRQAKLSVIFLVLGSEIFLILSGVIGLVMYAYYKDCDPYTTKAVSRPDQMMPHFVHEVAGKYKGLTGMFLAGVVSAALSTMSTGLNTLAGVIYEDFVEPSMTEKVTEKKASNIIKYIVVLLGGACVLLVLVIEKLGAILEISISFVGITTGTILGLFLLGILFPQANTKGAAVAGLASVALMTWTLIGARISIARGLINHPTLPTSIKGCTFNATDLITPTVMSNVETEVFPLYKLSIFNYSIVGCGSVIIIGLIVSYLTGPNKIEDINPDLLSPMVHPFISKSVKNKYQNVPLKPV